MLSPTEHRLRIFVCYAREDEHNVDALYQQLRTVGFDPWIDKNMLPGVEWESVVERRINQETDVAIVCISSILNDKVGYMRREIKMLLKKADQYPEDDCFLIPVRLEECSVPYQLARFNYVDSFTIDGFKKLIEALNYRAKQVGDCIIDDIDTALTKDMILNMIQNSVSSNAAKYLRLLCKSIKDGKIEPKILTLFCEHPYFLVRQIAIETIIELEKEDTLKLLSSYRHTSYHVSQTLIREYIKKRFMENTLDKEELQIGLTILNDLSNSKKVTETSKKKNKRLLDDLKEAYPL